MALLQWFDFLQGLSLASKVPVFGELGPVILAPFLYQAQNPGR